MTAFARFIFQPKVSAALVATGLLTFVVACVLAWTRLGDAGVDEFRADLDEFLPGTVAHEGSLPYSSIRTPFIVERKFPLRSGEVATTHGGLQITFDTSPGRIIVHLRIIDGRVSYFEILCGRDNSGAAKTATKKLKARYPGLSGKLRIDPYGV